MPTKVLDSQAGRNGVQKTFNFGGGKNTIDANDDGVSAYGYIIKSGGGDDIIIGSDFTGPPPSATGTIVADPTLNGDLLIGGMGSDTIVGGAGDDWIYGGNEDGSDGGKGKNPIVFNSLAGEIQRESLSPGETFTGGDDVITAGGGIGVSNFMYGDVQSISGDVTTTFVGGDDTLIGGANSTDDMVGDFSSTGGAIATTGGLDTFVIGQNGGDDTIWDFHVFEYVDDGVNVGDTIELVGFGFTQFSDLDDLWSADASGFAVLNLDGTVDGLGDTVTFLGITDSNDLSDSFVFTALV